MTRRGRAEPAARALAQLERLKAEFGTGLGPRKLALLRTLDRSRFATPARLVRYHELLCFAHAYPDDAAVEAWVRRSLARFQHRADLCRHAAALASSGIAGTAIDYRFYYPMARWLAARWPAALRLEWDEFENASRLDGLLASLALPAEAPAIDELEWSARAWLARMKRPGETDAAFLANRVAALPMADRARETLYDELDVPVRIEPGPGTPARTTARTELCGPTRHVTAPLDRTRPDLIATLAGPPLPLRALGRRAGAELVDLARTSMVTRQRDLDAFAYADPANVWLVDAGQGVQFAWMGMLAERRLLLESVHGCLTLKNGVPIGYVLTSALFGSSELAYNVFDTYRGVEAARIYAAMIATTARQFGSDTFAIDPYQLGHENSEALESGAWWFYWKLGFRPRDAGVSRLARREAALNAARPGRRSTIATLRRLASRPLFLDAGPRRDDVLGVMSLANAGLAVTDSIAQRFGSDRARAEMVCAREAATLLGVRSTRGWSAGEHLWWRRWAPLVLVLPGIRRWSPASRTALVQVIRAKGGPRESDYVRLSSAHAPLRAALTRLMERAPRPR